MASLVLCFLLLTKSNLSLFLDLFLSGRSVNWLSKFLPLYVVKTRQLDPRCDVSVAEEEWIPNFQVAGLLSTKDLRLQSFGTLEQKPVSAHERQCLWRVARLNLSYDISPNALWTTSVSKANEMESIAQAKFMAMEELFWVKVSSMCPLLLILLTLRSFQIFSTKFLALLTSITHYLVSLSH